MTPPARVQAAIEILDTVIAAARAAGPAADTVVLEYFRNRRYAGSGDRRAVRALVFDAVRALGDTPASGRAALLGLARAARPELLAHFGAGGHGPAALEPGEPQATPAAVPRWLEPHLAATFGADWPAHAAALLARAPIDVRANLLKTTRDELAAEFARDGLDPQATPRSPWGLRLPPDAAIAATAAHAEGRCEVMDEGSQLVALATGAAPGMTVVDLCAGAGGKTLALAAMMAGRGRLVACDTDRARLQELPPRAARAGTHAELRLLDPGRELAQLGTLHAGADIVLVDAPCSGSGTWRRNPEARWRLTPERLARLAATQDRLLAIAAALVRPGGRLVYAVCSVLPAEGAERAAAFLAAHPGFARADPGVPATLSPLGTGTDGFHVAAFTPTLPVGPPRPME